MTITANLPVFYEFAGDGSTTAFPFTSPLAAAADLKVFLTENGVRRQLVYGQEYSVQSIATAPEAIPLANAILFFAPPAGSRVRLERQTPIVQDTRYNNQGPNNQKTIENDFDYHTMVEQELAEMAGVASGAIPEIQQDIDDLYSTKANKGDPPTRHAASHALNGSDPISITAVGGVAFNDPKLYDARPPLAHAWRHRPDGDDPLYLNALGGVTLEQFNAAIANLQRQLDRKMPTAPTDGYGWLGAGSSWKRWLIDTGPLFIKDEYGFTVMVQRPQYTESPVWKIEEPFAVLNPDRRPGDSDNAFMVDEFGFTILKR